MVISGGGRRSKGRPTTVALAESTVDAHLGIKKMKSPDPSDPMRRTHQQVPKYCLTTHGVSADTRICPRAANKYCPLLANLSLNAVRVGSAR